MTEIQSPTTPRHQALINPHDPPARGRHRVTRSTRPEHLARTFVAARPRAVGA